MKRTGGYALAFVAALYLAWIIGCIIGIMIGEMT